MLLPWYLWWVSLIWSNVSHQKTLQFWQAFVGFLVLFCFRKIWFSKKCVFLWDTYYVPNVPNEQSDTHCLRTYTQYSLGKVTKKLVLLALHGIFDIEICQKGT